MNPSPGPWRWEEDGIEAHLSDSTGASFLRSDGDIKSDNATLIAAAPEMREMLLSLEEGDDDLCPWCHHNVRSDGEGHLDVCGLALLLERIR